MSASQVEATWYQTSSRKSKGRLPDVFQLLRDVPSPDWETMNRYWKSFAAAIDLVRMGLYWLPTMPQPSRRM